MPSLFRTGLFSGLFLVFLLATGATASPKLTGVLRWPGSSLRALAGDAAYLIHSHGDTVRIFGRKDDRLIHSFSLPLKEGIRSLTWSQDQKRLYLACGIDGLRIVNLENPATPQIAAYDINPADAGQKNASGETIAHTFAPVGVFYLETRLYVADFMYGLRVFDVSVPENPKEVAAFRQGAKEAAGGYLHVFAHREAGRTLVSVLDKYHGFRVFDTADEKPGDSEKKWEPAASFDMRSKTYYGQISLVTGLWAEGPRVFVTDEENGLTLLHLFNGSEDRNTLKIIKEGQCKTPGRATDILVDLPSRRAFIADTEKGLSVVGLEAVFDENPETRLEDGDLKAGESRTEDLGGSYSLWMFPGENRLFAASYEKGLSRIQPGSPPQIEITYAPALDVRRIAREDATLILADQGYLKGFRVLDIGSLLQPDPATAYFPAQLAEQKTEGTPVALYLAGKRLFTAEGQAGIGVHDLTRPETPVRIRQITRDILPDLEDARDLAVSGDTLFCLVRGKGLLIMNLASPENPVQQALLPEYAQAAALFLDGETLWIADTHAGLVPLSIRNPEAPETQTGIPIETPQSIWADPKRVLVAEGAQGIRILDKGTGQVATVALKDGAEALHVFTIGDFAFVSCGSSGTQMLDLSAAPPAVAAVLDSYGRALWGVGANQDLYMADATGGLAVLRFVMGNEEPPAPLPSVDTSASSCFMDSLFQEKRP